MKPTAKAFLGNFLLLIFGIITAISLAEMVLYWMGEPSYYQGHSSPLQFRFFSDRKKYGVIGYTNIPDSRIQFIYDGDPRGYFGSLNEVDHNTNSMGFRGANFLSRKGDTFRIVFLGDSFTFGEGVHDQDTYAEKTEDLLRAAYPQREFDSLNLGVGGYNTVQEAELLRILGLSLQPDVVVVGYTMNDAEPALFYFDQAAGKYRRRSPHAGIPPPSVGPWSPHFPFNTRIAQVIKKTITNRKRSRLTLEYYKALYKDGSSDWNRTSAAIETIGTLCRQQTIPCYSVLFPLLVDFSDYPLRSEHAKVKAEFEKNGFTVVDLLPYLADFKANDLWVHPTDQHPNEIVHRIAAEALTKAIAASSILAGNGDN